MFSDTAATRTRLSDAINRHNSTLENRDAELLRAIADDKRKLVTDCLAGIPASRKK